MMDMGGGCRSNGSAFQVLAWTFNPNRPLGLSCKRKGQHGILCPQHSEIKCWSNCTYPGFNLEEQSIGSMVFNFGFSKENFEAYICSNFMESTYESHCISGEGFYLVNT